MAVSIKGRVKASFLSAEMNAAGKSDGGTGNSQNRQGRVCRQLRMSGLAALYRKEMSDHILSKRFLIVLCLILLTSCASIYGAISSLSSETASDASYIFLKLFTLSGNSIPSFVSFIALLGPFVGLALGFDAINSERSEGTLNRLVAQPIYRDAVINGKFLAGAAIIFLMVFSMGLIAGAAGLLATGIPPTGEEFGRVVVLLFFTSVYICFWLALSILFSVICRHAATSAMAVIALWIFFALFMSLVVSIVANVLYPVGNTASAARILDNYNCQMNLNRLSPYYLYSEAVSTIMNPSVRSTNIILPQQLSGAVSGYLSLGQSLLLVWPHLTGLLALTVVVFAVSYISFMRKEIRGR